MTKACLSCHSEAAAQIHKTIHWTWVDPASPKDKPMGKGALTVNNYCVSIHGNEPRCTSCHIGYGWKDKSFDFTDASKVDCLVCHEQTGTYKKHPAMASCPPRSRWCSRATARNTCPPSGTRWRRASVGRRAELRGLPLLRRRRRHGEARRPRLLDDQANKALDVHMGVDGKNFDCTRCHTTSAHQVAGRIYSTPAATERKTLTQDDLTPRITCESCHTATPHKPGVKANDHTDKVACQSCHIPEFARALPTKMRWDWSTAGKKKDGKPYKEKGPLGTPAYDTQKGNFAWGEDVRPQYFWYNGTIDAVSLERHRPDPAGRAQLAGGPAERSQRAHRALQGAHGQAALRHGQQTMLVPHLFGPPDSGRLLGQVRLEARVRKRDEKGGAAVQRAVRLRRDELRLPDDPHGGPEREIRRLRRATPATTAAWPVSRASTCRAAMGTGWSSSSTARAAVIGSLAGVGLHALGRAVSGRRKEG